MELSKVLLSVNFCQHKFTGQITTNKNKQMIAAVRRITVYSLAGTTFGAIYHFRKRETTNSHYASCELAPHPNSLVTGLITFAYVCDTSSIMTGKLDHLTRDDIRAGISLRIQQHNNNNTGDTTTNTEAVYHVDVDKHGYLHHTCVESMDVASGSLHVQRRDNGRSLASGPIVKYNEQIQELSSA